MKQTVWHGCYKDGWQGLIVSDAMTQPAQGALFDRGEDYSAFEHPAKVSRALSRRIYAHLRDVYGLQPGAVVLDPFAGVLCFALDAILCGYQFIGVELESRFVTLALKNLAYWRHKYGPQPGSATVLQGDSRQLRAVLGQTAADGVVSSPPFLNVLNNYSSAENMQKLKNDAFRKGKTRSASLSPSMGHHYGDSEGQLGNMPAGQLPGALVSSPCYAGKGEILGTHDGVDYSKCKHGGTTQTRGRAANSHGYGSTPGNLGAMPTGQPPHALISSPPYADGCAHTGSVDSHPEHIQGGKQGVAVGYVVSSPPYAATLSDPREPGHGIDRSKMTYADGRALTATSSGPLPPTSYGASEGQLGAMPVGALPVDALVSSPPYNDSEIVDVRHLHFDARRKQRSIENKRVNGIPSGYGEHAGQLGNAAPTTFWAASLQILHECYAVLAPGAIAAWVVKAFVRNKAIVDFPGQWQAACELAGFVLLERIEASLVTEHGMQETLFGAPVVRRTKRMSYFRGDYERKHPDLAIDAEIVLIMHKPH